MLSSNQHRLSPAGESACAFLFMATDKQIEANRRNSQLSTGPRSTEGKAKSRCNALKTGIYAEMETLPNENPEALKALVDDFHAEWEPATPTESALVDILANSEWHLRRYRQIEARIYEFTKMCLESDASSGGNLCEVYDRKSGVFARLHRHMLNAEQTMHRTIRDLERLQSARRGSETTADAVASPSPEPQPPAPGLQPAARRQIGFVPPTGPQPVSGPPRSPSQSGL
jgi:hypothetical protein